MWSVLDAPVALDFRFAQPGGEGGAHHLVGVAAEHSETLASPPQRKCGSPVPRIVRTGRCACVDLDQSACLARLLLVDRV